MQLVPQWGAWLILSVTFLSCLAVPIPASLLMMAAGAFAASGDLSLPAVTLAALAGALVGDQAGFWLGRGGGGGLWRRLMARPGAAGMLLKSAADLERRAGMTVFLSRWLFSALGPYVNLAAGMTGTGWRRFTLASLAGETVWVLLYVGIGFAFAGRIQELGPALGNIAGAAAAAAVAFVLGRLLWRAAQDGGAPADGLDRAPNPDKDAAQPPVSADPMTKPP